MIEHRCSREKRGYGGVFVALERGDYKWRKGRAKERELKRERRPLSSLPWLSYSSSGSYCSYWLSEVNRTYWRNSKERRPEWQSKQVYWLNERLRRLFAGTQAGKGAPPSAETAHDCAACIDWQCQQQWRQFKEPSTAANVLPLTLLKRQAKKAKTKTMEQAGKVVSGTIAGS